MDFAVPVDHRVKIKENENRDEYVDLTRKLKKLWNMRVTAILIIVSVLKTFPKILESWLEQLDTRKRIEIIQTIALLRSVRILKRVLQTKGDLLSLRLQWKLISKTLVWSGKTDKYLDIAWDLKKTVEHKSDDYANCTWCSW